MRKTRVFVAAALMVGMTTAVSAKHLGPIEYGTERDEKVTYCNNLNDALFSLREETKAIESGESIYALAQRIGLLAQNLDCIAEKIKYEPLETICEGKSFLSYPDGRIVIGTSYLVRSKKGEGEIYVFPDGKVPENDLISCLDYQT